MAKVYKELSPDDHKHLDDLVELILDERSTADLYSAGHDWLCEDASTCYFDCQQRISDSQSNSVVAQLFRLLRDTLLTHRWPQTLDVFGGVIMEKSEIFEAQWKVGSEILMREGEDGIDHMHQFIENMKRISVVDSYQVILMFVIYSLKHLRLERAEDAFTAIPHRHKNSKIDPIRLQPFLQAYQGLVHYAKWLNTKSKFIYYTERHKVASGNSLSQVTSSLENIMQNQSNRALSYFENLSKHPGIWDVFIEKHIEILEYYERIDDAKMVLKNNCIINPDNPNSHKYLLNFCRRHGSTDDEIDLLKKIHELLPADSLTLELIHLIKDTDGDMAISMTFNLLDYQCWQNSHKAWSLLHDFLLNYSGSKKISRQWKCRKSWWEPYHFNPSQIQQCTDKDLLYIKASVASILLGPDNRFSESVNAAHVLGQFTEPDD